MTELSIAILAGLGGMLGWGLADFFAAKAMKQEKLNESQATFVMYAFTTILTWVIVIFSGQPFSSISLGDLVQLILFAAGNVVGYLLFFRALHVGNLGTVSTIFSTYGVGATVLSILFYGESTNPLRLLALLIVFLGIAGVSIQDTSKLTIIKGFFSVSLGALIFAVIFPAWDAFLGQKSSSLFWLAIINTLVAFLFYVFMYLTNKEKALPARGRGLLALAATATTVAFIATTLGYELTTLTSVVVVVSSAIPLISAVLGYIFFKERLIKTQYLGIIAIIVGTALLFFS